MNDLIDGFPNIFFETSNVPLPDGKPCYAPRSTVKLSNINASFGLALHMHQPTIPASTDHLPSAGLISNLQYMLEHPGSGDNHNAAVFLHCYKRMAEIIPELVAAGKNPRVMLDYSGNLFWGLRQIGGGEVLDALRLIACDSRYTPYVEWLGTMWSHAVVTSTPVPDIKLHMLAWRQHFASIFGEEAARRVKGFSPPEMHLPIHPDVCYEYVKALKECGYEWVMLQEHTVENLDGSGIRNPHFPHKLVARNSAGEVQEITALIKTQGSDTKLVAQMQPRSEAQGLSRASFAGAEIPPFVCQIGDGENGGVMMNEFPRDYKICFESVGFDGVVALNGSEYLELIRAAGAREKDFTPVQPVSQHRIWQKIKQPKSGAADEAIEALHKEDNSFNLDKGSWTNDRSWVSGYEDVMDPINQLSVSFHRKFDGGADRDSGAYRAAFLYLLLSQTSCFRYWGSGLWTEYAKELCRRGQEAIGGKVPPVVDKSIPKKVFNKEGEKTMKKEDKELLTIPEIKQEIEKHKWFESEKAGRDVGMEWAQQDWLSRYGSAWRKKFKNPSPLRRVLSKAAPKTTKAKKK